MTVDQFSQMAVPIALVVVAALALYAAMLWSRVWRESRQRARESAEADRDRQQRHGELRASIAVLARAQLQGQVSRTEAAIRIATLARGLQPSDAELTLYQPFSELAVATSHIPVLDAWKALSTKDKDRFDSEREGLEAVHASALDEAARGLLQHPALVEALR